jgi:S-adenosylmethionine hydrolase
VGTKEVTTHRTAYAQGMHNEVFAIVGSMGFVELATNRGSAAALTGANRGSEVAIQLEGIGAAMGAPAAATV